MRDASSTARTRLALFRAQQRRLARRQRRSENGESLFVPQSSLRSSALLEGVAEAAPLAPQAPPPARPDPRASTSCVACSCRCAAAPHGYRFAEPSCRTREVQAQAQALGPVAQQLLHGRQVPGLLPNVRSVAWAGAFSRLAGVYCDQPVRASAVPPARPRSTTVFSHSQTVVLCGSCSAVLCTPTGGKARLTEGERQDHGRRQGDGDACAAAAGAREHSTGCLAGDVDGQARGGVAARGGSAAPS